MLRKKNLRQLLKLNFNLFLIGLIIFLGLSSSSNAQIDQQNDQTKVEIPNQQSSATQTIQNTSDVPKDTEAPKTAPQNVHSDSPEADEIDAELIQRQKEIEKSFGALYESKKANQPNAPKEEALFDHEAAIKNYASLMNNKLSKDDLKKMKLHEAIREALKPIQLLSEKEILDQLKANIKGTKSEKYLGYFPQLTVIAVKLIKDKDALPELAKILEDKDKLIKFSAVMIASIFLGFFIGKIISTKSENLITIFGYFVLRVVVLFGIRLGIIYYFFGENLRPLLNIIINNI